MIDWTISFGSLLQIGAFLIAGIGAFFALRTDIRILRHDMKTVELRQEGLSSSMEQLSQVLVSVARQDERISRAEKTIDEMRHGQGFVNPMRS